MAKTFIYRFLTLFPVLEQIPDFIIMILNSNELRISPLMPLCFISGI